MTAIAPGPRTADGVTADSRPLGRLPSLLLIGLLVAGCIAGAPSGFGLVWFVPYAGVGAVLAVRRPTASIGWILLGIGLGFVLVTLPVDATAEQFANGTVSIAAAVMAVITAEMGAGLFYLFSLLALVFPSGRLPAGRAGLAARIGLAVGLACLVAGIFTPVISVNLWGSATSGPVRNPLAVLPDLGIWQAITPDTLILPVVVLMAAASLSLVVRFRRSRGVERQQLRWLAAALSFVVVAVIGGFVLGLVFPQLAESGLVWLGAVVAFPCVPIAVGLAVLRYRLYEIDRIISRTIGWALVTGLLVGVFGAVVIALQGLLQGFTQGQTLAVAASTLVAFALFQPLRRRVQAAVDHRFDRARYDAQGIADTFAERVRNQVDLVNLRLSLVQTAGQSVRPQTAGVWLRASKEPRS